MLKHLLKACGILSLVFMASTDVIGQTNFTITNDNADCPVDYKIFPGSGGCSGTLTAISGTCSGSSVCYETIPSGDIVIKIYTQDTYTTNSITVYDGHCGSTTGSYGNCDSATSNVEYIQSNDELHVWE